MSSDDIVFTEEVKYREPRRVRRPDRDRKWACLAYEVPGAADLPIFLDRQPADAIERHALRDTTVELGGILLGMECLDDQTGHPFVWITQALEAKHFENTQASFTYTHESWEEINRERDRQFPDLDIVGWYHTHPDFGVFLSSHDMFICRHFFAQPLQVAYVIDPVRQTRGFFHWRQGNMIQVGGFFLTADRAERSALARFVNDLEEIPNPEGGGSGLSPRLEAELIAMLTRPHLPTAADRTQAAAVFTLLGAVLGALGLAVLIWLNALGGSIRDQNERLAQVETSLKSVSAQELEHERTQARIDAKEAALDALLGDVKVGAGQEPFLKAYNQLLDDLNRVRDRQAADRYLGLELDRTRATVQQLVADLKKTAQQAEEFQKEALVATDLRKDLEKSEARVEDLENSLVNKVNYIQEIEDARTGKLILQYHRTWYVAAVGWVVSLLLGLGLVIALLRRLSAEDSETPGEPRPMGPDLDPPHTIT